MFSPQSSTDILQRLVAFPTVSSTSNHEISTWLDRYLTSLGFDVEVTKYDDAEGVTKVNLVACRDPVSQSSRIRNEGQTGGGQIEGGLAYFCHTDVVPADGWTGPGGNPFNAVIQDQRIYGRGTCDMKGSLVSMLDAARQLRHEDQIAPLWIVCTADEEVGFEGAKHLVRHSAAYRRIVAAQPLAIIGEPTRLNVVHAHKGISGFRIISRGRAAHSSTTDGINANEAMVPMLQMLAELGERTRRDSRYNDARFDPPTLSWNFGVSDGSRAVNITPEKSIAWVSLRPMPQIDGEDLIQIAADRARLLGLEFQRFSGGSPFWCEPDAKSIEDLCSLAGGTAQTVCYGTDGGEFHELQDRVVLGPGDIAQAHTTDEFLSLEQLRLGTELYAAAIRHWCTAEDGHLRAKASTEPGA